MSNEPPGHTLPVRQLRAAAFTIPTDAPESDGTLQWDSTTLVVTEVRAGDWTGFGYTYGPAAVADLIREKLSVVVEGADAFDIERLWHRQIAALRNSGSQGLSAMAVSAVDVALWDLKAQALGAPLGRLLGQVREDMPVYGSGGFTSYSDARLQEQFVGWAAEGIRRFKMKVGRDPARDPERVASARSAIGSDGELFVDANSAYSRGEALLWAGRFAEFGVTWLEQPLAPTDLEGLRFLRQREPAGMEIADGEYGYDLAYFRRLLEAQAVDVVMADATRCGGYTGFLKVATLCEAWGLPLSSHCAPGLHVPVACAARPFRHGEYFHDHARIEAAFLDGVPPLRDGRLHPRPDRAGHGLKFKWAEAERHAA